MVEILQDADYTECPVCANPAWSDVRPIPQEEPLIPVVQIMYSNDFVDAMDMFRGVLSMELKDERALWLTGKVILLNSANYTAWHYRRQCILALKTRVLDIIDEEYMFLKKMATESPKNYQLWQ